MNKVTLIGRLTRDPEVRFSQSVNGQMVVAKYNLAVNRRFKTDGQPDADFINCTALGKTAEFVEKYLFKGMKIAVVGEWRTGSYENKDGNKVYTNECLVLEHEFVESKGSDNSSEKGQKAKQRTVPTGDGFMNIPDNVDDSSLPFNF